MAAATISGNPGRETPPAWSWSWKGIASGAKRPSSRVGPLPNVAWRSAGVRRSL